MCVFTGVAMSRRTIACFASTCAMRIAPRDSWICASKEVGGGAPSSLIPNSLVMPFEEGSMLKYSQKAKCRKPCVDYLVDLPLSLGQQFRLIVRLARVHGCCLLVKFGEGQCRDGEELYL